MSLSPSIILIISSIIVFKQCIAGCIKIDMNRIAVIKTIGPPSRLGYKEAWGIVDSFKISFESNFASSGWSSCTYEHSTGYPSNSFRNSQGDNCTPATGTSGPDGFYNCYMQFPPIYLSETQFENGFQLDVDGQIGDWNMANNGPIWNYNHEFNTNPIYTAADVQQSGEIEFYATRTGPFGRIARHFFKASYHSGAECSFNIGDYFFCPLSVTNTGNSAQYGVNAYSTYYEGNSPLIILSPHGGALEPTTIPNRHAGCWDTGNQQCIYTTDCEVNSGFSEDSGKCPVTTGRDDKTLELALCLYNRTAFTTSEILRPHLITNNLHRKKLDPNRELPEATLGNHITTTTWNEIQDWIQDAKDAAQQKCGFGLLIDLHGQTKNVYINLGYRLREDELVKTNTALDADVDKTSIKYLVENSVQSDASLSEVIRGEFGLGSLLSRYGYDVIPSESLKSPPNNIRFYGGRTVTTLWHGSRDQGTNDAIQVEINEDLRVNDADRDKLCTDMSNALVQWMTHWYDMKQCVSSCIKIDMNRIAVIKTNGPNPILGYKQEWGIYNSFKISFESNFASSGWSSCTYEHSGGYPSNSFRDSEGGDCKPATGTSGSAGFYDCYMQFPPIYLSETQFENGFRVDVDGQIGDWDKDNNNEWIFDNGPIWNYNHEFNTNAIYTAADVEQSGEIEMYGTRTGPEGRKARHFFKASYHSGNDCSFDVNQYFQC